MNFVFIFGPPAVGKMTVGQELGKQLGYGLFHNHMTIEPLLKIFPHGSPEFNYLNNLFRIEILKQASSGKRNGFIMTYAWALNIPEDKDEVDSYLDIFKSKNASICYVELEAAQEKRLSRNHTPNRLEEKPSKRDFEFSDANLKSSDVKYVQNTSEKLPFFYPDRHLKINNENKSPAEVAEEVISHFKFIKV